MPRNDGYRTNFISDDLAVAFPELSATQVNDLVLADSKKTGELVYPHFSVFLSQTRRFPYFTATNINGDQFQKIPRKKIFPGGSDQWSIDNRVDQFQWGSHLYSAPKSDFQRGHMTKREDPQWGEDEQVALDAARATFHFTNCVPQVGELNTQEWGKLETYILEKTSVPGKLKVCVFTGPVLADEDPYFITEVEGREVQIPTLFWKIVYYTEDDKSLSRAGFLMGQENILFDKKIVVRKARPAATRLAIHQRIFQDFEDAAIYQVNISTLQELTGLRFPDANDPFTDSRPLKLIIKKVQVPVAASHVERLSAIEESNEKVEFPNMQLLGGARRSPATASIQAHRVAPMMERESLSAARVGPEQQYTDEMKRHFGYYAAWSPGTPLKLGDVGIVKNNVFTRISDIASLGIAMPVATQEGQPVDLKYSSEGSVSIKTKLSGTVPDAGSALTQGDAGITVEFSRDKSTLFQANDCRTKLINDTVSLGEKVLDLFRNGKWDKRWAVITELIEAGSTTILIANTGGAKIELKANANVKATNLNIADASFEFSAANTHAINTEIIAKQGLTPLFKIMGIKTSLFSSPVFSPKSIRPIDLLTPADLDDPSKKKKITFGLLSDDIHE